MTSEQAASITRFNVAHRESRDGPDVPAGVVAIDAAHHVTVVQAEPQFSNLLGLAADMVNSGNSFAVRISPSEHLVDAEVDPAPLTKRLVPRDDPGAREALLTVLDRTYNLVLKVMD